MKERWLGLNAGVLLLAATHLVLDAYGNVLAPLLPLFIPQMRLSLAAAGLLQTIFQMASSVSQLAFGHLADRWRPRPLLSGARAGWAMSFYITAGSIGFSIGPMICAAGAASRRCARMSGL